MVVIDFLLKSLNIGYTCSIKSGSKKYEIPSPKKSIVLKIKCMHAGKQNW